MKIGDRVRLPWGVEATIKYVEHDLELFLVRVDGIHYAFRDDELEVIMTEEEKRQHALRIAAEILSLADFSYVCEDKSLEDATERELREIHDMIYSEVEVTFND